MKNRNIVVALITLFVFASLLVVCQSKDTADSTNTSESKYTEYHCDVKLFHLATTIEIDKDGEDFAKVSGDIFRFVTDPLSMYDLDDNKVAYAGDAYHFFAQDSHTIYVDGSLSVEMVGLFRVLGEAYDIYNEAGEKIAYVSFNELNTNGSMYDMDNNLIADFRSNLFFKDFDVRIFEDCTLDEKTVLMIFCSYYSDQAADAEAASAHSSND